MLESFWQALVPFLVGIGQRERTNAILGRPASSRRFPKARLGKNRFLPKQPPHRCNGVAERRFALGVANSLPFHLPRIDLASLAAILIAFAASRFEIEDQVGHILA